MMNFFLQYTLNTLSDEKQRFFHFSYQAQKREVLTAYMAMVLPALWGFTVCMLATQASLSQALCVSLFLSGGHYLYLKKWQHWFLFIATFGGGALWFLFDFFRLCSITTTYNNKLAQALFTQLQKEEQIDRLSLLERLELFAQTQSGHSLDKETSKDIAPTMVSF